jgi:threonine/homoserine/homoserine lactone efflux protein
LIVDAAFLVAAVLLAVTPGPGLAYVVARTAAGGRADGLASCIGTAFGGMVHVVAAALGVSALIASSAIAFSLVKWAGAAYLIFLGIRALVTQGAESFEGEKVRSGALAAFRDGVFVEALNVKTTLFFLAFLPQFIDPSHNVVRQLVLLGSISVLLNTLADFAAVLGAAKLLSSGAARAMRQRVLRKTSGATMLALGLYLAAAKRATS